MPINVQYALWGIVVVLVLGTVIIGAKRFLKPSAGDTELWLRMRSWWVMAGLFILAIAVNRELSVIFFGLLSFLALKEYFSIIPTRRADRRVLFWTYWQFPSNTCGCGLAGTACSSFLFPYMCFYLCRCA